MKTNKFLNINIIIVYYLLVINNICYANTTSEVMFIKQDINTTEIEIKVILEAIKTNNIAIINEIISNHNFAVTKLLLINTPGSNIKLKKIILTNILNDDTNFVENGKLIYFTNNEVYKDFIEYFKKELSKFSHLKCDIFNGEDRERYVRSLK